MTTKAKPPAKPSPLLAVWRGMSALLDRVIALETENASMKARLETMESRR